MNMNAIWGKTEDVREALALGAGAAEVWAYVEASLSPDSPEARRIEALGAGDVHRVELGHGCFAMEQVYFGKTADAAKWESHLVYTDWQVIVAGTERMAVAPVAELQITEDHGAEKDVRFHAAPSQPQERVMVRGDVAVFTPSDAHQPSVAVSPDVLIRKTVVKVPQGL